MESSQHALPQVITKKSSQHVLDTGKNAISWTIDSIIGELTAQSMQSKQAASPGRRAM
jgi:hypothetical protein